MKINVTKTKKISETMIKVNGGSRERLVYVGDILGALEKAEKQLKKLNIPKKAWENCIIEIDGGGVSNSYKYAAYSTKVTIKKFKSGWFMTYASRDHAIKTSYGKYQTSTLKLSTEAKTYLPTSFEL